MRRVCDFVDRETLSSIYNALVRPCFDYCSELWDTFGVGLSSRFQTTLDTIQDIVNFDPVRMKSQFQPKLFRREMRETGKNEPKSPHASEPAMKKLVHNIPRTSNQLHAENVQAANFISKNFTQMHQGAST